jgi:hypothetical protein
MVSDQMKRALIVVPLLLAATAPAVGQGDPSVLTTIDPPAITVGDPVRVVVTVTHAPGSQVVWPDPIALDPFELLDMRLLEGVAEATTMHSSAELTLTAFELGDVTLPAMEIEVVDAAGDTVTISTDAVSVTVESVGRDEANEMRDIKGPLAVPFSPVSLLPWLVGVAGLGAIVYWLYWRYRGRARPEVVAPAVPPRPAHELAYESLQALEASGLLELGEVKTYHIRVSDILRVYVDGRFAVEAMEMTTGEVLRGLRGAGVSGSVIDDCRQLLERCDLVKFAKFRPEPPACRDLVLLARRLVDVTRQADTTPTEAEAETSAHVA